MGSFFPVQSGIPGVRRVDKGMVDNINYFESMSLFGPYWGDSFVSPMNLHNDSGVCSSFASYLATHVDGKIITTGSASVRPTVYDVAMNKIVDNSSYAMIDASSGIGCAFEHESYAYFLCNDYIAGTCYFRRLDPVAKTWTALASLPDSPASLKKMAWVFLGIADGFAFFSPIACKSDVTAGDTPYIYKYHIASNSWVPTTVKLPWMPASLKANNDYATSYGDTYEDGWSGQWRVYLQQAYASACQYDTSHFLVVPRTQGMRSTISSVFKFDASDNTPSLHCAFPSNYVRPQVDGHKKTNTTEAIRTSQSFREYIAHHNGVTFLYRPNGSTLLAYVESQGRYYTIPVSHSVEKIEKAVVASGKMYLIGGTISVNVSAYSDFQVTVTGGAVIDLEKLSVFLKSEKTLGIQMSSFA